MRQNTGQKKLRIWILFTQCPCVQHKLVTDYSQETSSSRAPELQKVTPVVAFNSAPNDSAAFGPTATIFHDRVILIAIKELLKWPDILDLKLSISGALTEIKNLFTFRLYSWKCISLVALWVFIIVFWAGLWGYRVIDDVLRCICKDATLNNYFFSLMH